MIISNQTEIISILLQEKNESSDGFFYKEKKKRRIHFRSYKLELKLKLKLLYSPARKRILFLSYHM